MRGVIELEKVTKKICCAKSIQSPTFMALAATIVHSTQIDLDILHKPRHAEGLFNPNPINQKKMVIDFGYPCRFIKTLNENRLWLL
jgi:hypothetical protein